tara:strand:- start:349 stop:576 length:228 start_codon:yes stop_codon:yes gene_type:complete
MNNLNLHRVTEIEISETTSHEQEPSEYVDGGGYSNRKITITSNGFLFTINLFTDTVFIDDGITAEQLTITSTKEK